MAGGIVRGARLHVGAREAEGLAEAEPELGMILAAALFLDQVFEQQLARGDVVRMRVHRADERRERHRVMKVLRGVIAQLFAAERAAGPALIKRMVEQMLGRDSRVESLYGIHRFDLQSVVSAGVY